MAMEMVTMTATMMAMADGRRQQQRGWPKAAATAMANSDSGRDGQH